MSGRDLPTCASGCPIVEVRSWHLLIPVNEGDSEAGVFEQGIRRAQSNDTCAIERLNCVRSPSTA